MVLGVGKKPGFPNLGSTGILGCIIFFVVDCPVHYGLFSSITGLYLLDARAPLPP